jgi:hypothetical protein
MSPAPEPERARSRQLRGVRRYIRYALGEIVLIFLGITLAMAFSNWNEGRHVRKQELEALADIVTNLKANDGKFRRNIKADTDDVAACERFVAALGRSEPWSDALGRDLRQCRWWTSPFLNSAAYESLKAKGTDLIVEPELRSSIVNLYEQVYAYLVNDRDKVFWAFHAAVMEPVFNRHVHPAAPDQYVPNDYASLLDSTEFSNMLLQKIDIQKGSIEDQQEALAETEKVIGLIEARLAAEPR